MGNENRGVRKEILEMADDVVEIPMYAPPSCHNVAVAAAIVMYEYRKQRAGCTLEN